MFRTVQRSMLILPVNVPRFVEKAYMRGADAILLDLEDGVPLQEKAQAREALPESVAMAGKGGADVLIRVNNEPGLLRGDVDAAVGPGLHGLFVPKVETAELIAVIDAWITLLEPARGLQTGQVKISAHIEHPRGLSALNDILAASQRIESVSLGTDDYCLALGVEPSPDGSELYLALSVMITAAVAADITPLGIMGSVADYTDTSGFRRAAERGKQLGTKGAYCIHPSQVDILNQVFAPGEDDTRYARRIVEVFEKAVADGRGSTSLDGVMIDTPVYKRAKQTLERAAAVEQKEERKRSALDQLGRQEK